MKKKLFGQNINPDCNYCENGTNEDNITYCQKGKRIINSKCRSFKYDPIMRIPNSHSGMGNYSAEDFKL